MSYGTNPFHKRIRLSSALYGQDGAILYVTICTDKRVAAFKDTDLAEACVGVLRDQTHICHVPVYAYCLMPDHSHLLLGPGPEVDVIRFVGRFKSLTTRLAWGQGIQGKLWQKSFYDRFLRREEDVEDVAMYVVHNPVRKGLVSEWKAYPFAGSFVFDL